MAETELLIRESGTPQGLCYTSLTNDIPIIARYLRAVFNGNEINYGSTTPAAADRTKPWIRTNSDGTDDGVWNYSNGFWLQKYPFPTGFIAIAPPGTTLADIDALDGGETAAVTSVTGPFWEEVVALRARSPMGAGTLPSGAVITESGTSGEEKHTPTLTEMFRHRHNFSTTDGQQILVKQVPSNVGSIDQTGSLEYAFADPMDEAGDSTPFNVVHPVLGVIFLQRTARLYRRRNG